MLLCFSSRFIYEYIKNKIIEMIRSLIKVQCIYNERENEVNTFHIKLGNLVFSFEYLFNSLIFTFVINQRIVIVLLHELHIDISS